MRVHGVQLGLIPRGVPLRTPTLTDGQALLRPWAQADVPELVQAGADPQVTSIPTWTTELAGVWVHQQYRAAVCGDAVCLAVCAADAPQFAVGGASLIDVDAANRSGELGYWLAPSARGRGLAGAAVRLLAGHAFGEAEIERLELRISPVNEPARTLAGRCGFALEGVMRDGLRGDGQREDLELWAAVRPRARTVPGELPAGPTVRS